jgi:XTP/dITP diphosphohydrolase
MRLVLATRNPGKIIELQALLPDAEIVGFDDEVEESGSTFEENARLKARGAHAKTGLPSLADDSGLEVDALGGQPGVHSARFAENALARNAKLVALLKSHAPPYTARFRCALALEPDGIVTTGTCEGEIILEPRGEGGFGYDPHFFISSLGKTMAELQKEEKNAISHRGQAFRKMIAHLPIKSK